MSVLTYNSIQLPLPVTTMFRQEAVYDEESHTDWCGERFTIQVQCVLNVNYLNIITAANKELLNPAEIMNVVRSMLLKPRKQLSFKVNFVEMIPQAQGKLEGTVDIRNGPRPTHCNIHQLTDVSFLLDYGIVAEYWENTSADGTSKNKQGGDVLFNRWKEIVELDECMRTRRTREGYFRIRSDNASGAIPDNLRSKMAVVSIPKGFLRESSRYEQSQDGLTLRYRLVDREVFKLPPSPAYKAEGEYVDQSDGFMAQYRSASVRVRLYGSVRTPQDQLLDAAMSVLTGKIQANLGKPLAVPIKGKESFLFTRPIYTNLATKIWMYDNIVEVTGTAMVNLSTTTEFQMATGWSGNAITFTPLSDGVDNEGPTYYDRGTAGLLLQAAAYYDPSAKTPEMGKGRMVAKENASVSKIQGDKTVTMAPEVQLPGSLPGTAGKVPEK